MTTSVFERMAPSVMPVTSEEFARAARLLHQRTGIVVGEHKKEMATRTLSMRARKLGVQTVAEYLGYLSQNPDGLEWEEFVNSFTINHTAFFREQHHFETLKMFVKTRKAPINIWCSAASTGEEPYSIAMTLLETLPNAASQCFIWATDIDTQAIARAERGVYTFDRVKTVPEPLLRKYFLRGKDEKNGLVRVKPVLQSMIKYEPLNLLSPRWPTDKKFDAIFCRNIMIYFDKETQTKILERFAPLMKPEGLLFAGHSENFTYLTNAFKLQGQTVYAVSR